MASKKIEEYKAEVKMGKSLQTTTEKTVKIHIGVVFGVCALFGLVNILTGFLVLGLIIIGAGTVVSALSITVLKKTSMVFRGTLLSMTQIAIIITMAILKNELQNMFPLMLASMAIASVYFNVRLLVIKWILIDVAALGGCVFMEFCYGNATLEQIIKGLLGVNIGAALIIYLVRCSIRYISSSRDASNEAEKLVSQVQDQMAVGEELMAKQTEVVEQIANISSKVNQSSSLMLEIADRINSSAEEQNQTVSDIAIDINKIAEETQKGLNESKKASSVAEESKNIILENNEEMQKMLLAMSEIDESSQKIESIINTIEDIAFQTNILALNASVEAARAGDAGRGFAVVADEVRNLATKSKEAAETTSALIKSSIQSVDKGTAIAKNAADRMSMVIESSEKSAEHARLISEFSHAQAESIEMIKQRMELISQSVSNSSQTSIESANIARSVANEAKSMDEIVKNFKKI